MLQRAAHRLLALLLCLGIPSVALAQPEEETELEKIKKEDIAPRLQEIRTLFSKLQEVSKEPAPIDKKSTAAPGQWYRLQAWETPGEQGFNLRKIVVNSRDKSGELERSFFYQGPLLAFALYVKTPPGKAKARKKEEERMYYSWTHNGIPIRWQHNNDIHDTMDGHAFRWGEQGIRDSMVAKDLVDRGSSSRPFEPITCLVDEEVCPENGKYCVSTLSLYPPPGFPVQKDLCRGARLYAGQQCRK